jgi:hypothetical protein
MSTKFLQQCIEEEKMRDAIRRSLSDEKREVIDHLFGQFEKIWWARTVPALHAMFFSPLATFFVIICHYHFSGHVFRNDFWAMTVFTLGFLFLAYKATFHFLTLLYWKNVSQIHQDIAQDFKKNIDHWELLWLIRSKSCERDKEIATQIMQKLLRESSLN